MSISGDGPLGGAVHAKACALALAGLLAGCMGGPKAPVTNGIEIAVAPLTLPGVSKVCYDIRVTNGAGGTGETVWSRGTPGLNGGTADSGAICSDKYGDADGGDVSYVGTCDADGQLDADAAGERINSVTVWFDGIYDDGGAYVDPAGAQAWRDPCAPPAGCTLDVLCEENADASVAFDFTVMRAAHQGFFDVAVNFEDIFCSGKYDSCYTTGPIELLFGDGVGDGPGRDRTGVFAMACTAGTGTGITTDLLMSEVQVSCPAPNAVAFVLPIAGLSPAGGVHTVNVAFGVAGPTAVEYALYYGRENINCGTSASPVACNKAYLNLAIDLEDLPAGCSLSLQATAQDASAPAFTNGAVTTMASSGTTYPFIAVAGADLSQTACIQNPLDGTGSTVTTFYGSSLSGGTPPSPMCIHSQDGAAPAATGSPDCGVAPQPLAPTVASVTPSSGPTTGGTGVTLIGTNFTAATSVTFDGVAATGVLVGSPTSITATTPAHAAVGAVAVAVTNANGTGTGSGLYTYTAAVAPLRVFLTNGTFSGALGGLAAADTICQNEAQAAIPTSQA